MAIFRPSPLVASISGSVGGIQFLSGAGGNVVRARPGKRSQKTKAVLNQQAVYNGAVRAWQGLVPEQRELWVAMARVLSRRNKLSLPRKLSPFQTYMRASIPNFLNSGFYSTLPGENLITQAPGDYLFTSQTAAAINFTMNAVDPFGDFFFQVYVGFSINHPEWKNQRRERLVFSAPYGVVPDIQLIPTWPEDFALPQTGWKIFLRTRVLEAGAWPGPSVKTDFIVG